MPQVWSAKDERQYQHIRKGAMERGRNAEEAEEIAARTVNKQRRREGRTPMKTSQGTGNPNLSLDERSKRELYNRAQELGIAGRSTMNKSELIQAIRRKQ